MSMPSRPRSLIRVMAVEAKVERPDDVEAGLAKLEL